MKYVYIILILLCCDWANAQKPMPFQFDRNPDKLNIDFSDHTLFFEDTSGMLHSLTWIQEQTFLPFKEKRNERATHSNKSLIVTWLTFTFNNLSRDTLSLYFFCGLFEELKAYNDKGKLIADAKFSGSHQNVPLRTMYVPLTILPGEEAQFWIQVTNHVVAIMPIISRLYSYPQALEEELRAEKNDNRLLLGLCLIAGSLFFMALYALLNFWLNRHRTFLYYSLYSGLSFLVVLGWINMRFDLQILPFPFFPPDMFALMFLLHALFISNMIGVRNGFPYIRPVIITLMILLAIKQVWMIGEFLTGELLFADNFYYQLKLWPEVSIVMLMAILTLASKSPVKKFLIAGMISLVIITLFPMIFHFYIESLPKSLSLFFNYPPFFAFLGVTVEAFCFALALAYQARLNELEKFEIQEDYAVQLKQEIALRTEEIEAQTKLLEAERLKQVELQFERKLLETEMGTIRAQMNPHFIYNCLNSIKLYTAENNAAAAKEYLSKFSRLMRLVLENSRDEKITLENELEALVLYIELERMRFKDKVEFEIKIDPRIEVEFIEIPSLLIQPHVENSIWHGIMHKNGKGKVSVEFDVLDERNLQVKIIDDGVGRIVADKLKSKSATKNKSLGLRMTSERLSLINKVFNMKIDIHVNDLVDESGQPAGTEVVIIIPI